MRQASRRGFTLLEVLIALVVLAVSIGAVVSQAASLNRNGVHLANKTYALWVAQNRIAELQLSNAALEVSEVRGVSELAGRTWHWTQRVSNVGTATTLQRVDVRVHERRPAATLSEQGPGPLVELSGFVGSGERP